MQEPSQLSLPQLSQPPCSSHRLCETAESSLCCESQSCLSRFALCNRVTLYPSLPNCRNSVGSLTCKPMGWHVMWPLTSMWGCVHALEFRALAPATTLLSSQRTFSNCLVGLFVFFFLLCFSQLLKTTANLRLDCTIHHVLTWFYLPIITRWMLWEFK